MHIVALTGSFYPNIMAPSACIKPYLIELAKEHNVDVICPVSNHYIRDCVEMNGLKIHYVSNYLNDIYVKAYSNLIENRHRYVSKIILLLIRIIKYIQEKFIPIPYDSSMINQYMERLMVLNSQKKIDVIVSVTYPFHTHVVALKYKEIIPSVKWLSYTTDPLAYNEANPIAPWKKNDAIKIEKKVYNTCDTCIITEELYDNLVKDYCINSNKILVLPYLVETDNVHKENMGCMHEGIRVLYAGCLFYNVRNPRTMLNIFSRLKNVDLYLYVTGDRKCRKMLNRGFPLNIHINGLVSREEYFKLLSNADILINLSNNAKLQAPHKLMELISTGKPIINFYYFKNSGYRIIEQYPLGINIFNKCEPEEMISAINKFITKNNNKCLSETEIKNIFKEYLLSYQIDNIKLLLMQ